MKKYILIFAILFSSSMQLFAQTTVEQKNQHYKKRIVKAIDLREQQNKPLFSHNAELTKLLMAAMKNGDITMYTNDSLATVVNYSDIESKLQIVTPYNGEEPIDSDDFGFNTAPQSYYFEPRDIYQLELTQDWLFDNKHSVLNKQNVSITLYIPADHPDNVRGFQMPIASLKFEDCVNLWKDNPKAIWFNTQNDASHLNLSDAFKLELYHSYLIKVSNPDNAEIADNFPGRKGIIESQNQEMKLMEYESNLWEN